MTTDRDALRARVASRVAEMTAEIVAEVSGELLCKAWSDGRSYDLITDNNLAAMIDAEIVARLGELGNRVAVEHVKAWLRDNPDYSPHVDIDRLNVAGVDGEQDYVWARPSEPRDEDRNVNGLLKDTVFVRITRASRVFQHAA